MWTDFTDAFMLGPLPVRPLVLILFTALLASTPAGAETTRVRTHVVYSGQRLGSIAKRYGVSVEALCTANGIQSNDRIRPGQRLVIPARDDRDGSRARALNAAAPSRGTRDRAEDRAASAPRTHRVELGQRLESIARRYNTTVDALCRENGLTEKSVLRPGQVLNLPGGGHAAPRETTGYRAYFRPPKKKGRVELIGYNETFRGHVYDKKDRMLPGAAAGIARVLGATGSRPKLDPRLVRLLVEISDRFGGRPLRIVSGYRSTSYFSDSRHRVSRAVDFSVLGVPNDALRDYLRTLSKVGVGYYPNSSFVHLDVREYAAYWVDYAGPGEAPRTRLARNTTAEPHPELHEEEPRDLPDGDRPARPPEPSAATAAGAEKPALVEASEAATPAATVPASDTAGAQ